VSIVQLAEHWIVAPKVVGSNPSIYPININFLHKKINNFIFEFSIMMRGVAIFFLHKTYFLTHYYLLSDLLWQEALILDFLQKKVINNWTQKFLVISSYLFNERVVFDLIIKFFLDLFIWPMHRLFIFQINNVSSLLTVVFFIWCSIVIFTNFLYLFGLLF
jgi:hypothetical protein